MSITRNQLEAGKTLVYSPFHAMAAGLYLVTAKWEKACLGTAVLPDMPQREKTAYLFYAHIAIWSETPEAYFRLGRKDRWLARYLDGLLGPGKALKEGMVVLYQGQPYRVDCQFADEPRLWYIDQLPIPEDVRELISRRTYVHPNQVTIIEAAQDGLLVPVLSDTHKEAHLLRPNTEKDARLPRRKRAPPDRIVIGIDPGLALVGYTVLRQTRDQLTLLACDVIRTAAKTPLEDRLSSMYEQMKRILTTYHPTEAAVESLFFGANRRTAMAVAQARGVLLLALHQQHIPITNYTPNQVKLAVTGSGRARKSQVGEQVRVLLSLGAVPRPDDAADAAAVALCHALSRVAFYE